MSKDKQLDRLNADAIEIPMLKLNCFLVIL